MLAQAVLRGRTKGYRHHPQLDRFRAQARPVGAIAEYLVAVHSESLVRGYAFASEKIGRARHRGRIAVRHGQLRCEWGHLREKLARRNPEWLARLGDVSRPEPHPLFRVVPGGVEDWERGKPPAGAG